MSRFNLRQKPRISYYEPDEPNLDEYVFCDKCCDYVYEYCSIHGALLVIPDDKVPAKSPFPPFVPRAALTVPHVFLHLAPSVIPGAGLGVFSTLTLPRGVRFGPYRGQRSTEVDSMYCWQIYDRNNKPSHVVDAADPNRSNWMRYVNCARHWCEQNLVAFQYQGQLYYRTIKVIPRFTELMVFYGSEFAHSLNIDVRRYNSPAGYAQKYGAPAPKKPKLNTQAETATQELKTSLVEEKASTAKESTSASHHKTLHMNSEASKKPQTKKGQPKVTPNNKKSIVGKTKAVFKTPRKPKTKDVSLQKISKKESVKKETAIDAITVDAITPLAEAPNKNKSITENTAEASKINTTKNNCADSVNEFHCNTRTKQFNNKNLIIQDSISKQDLHFYCDQCNYKYNTQDVLARHMKLHDISRLHKCNECGYRYGTKTKLQTHERIHTGEKPYSCSLCSYKSTQKSHLKLHERTHTGEKPYSCSLCSYKCTQKSSLKLHERTHTGEKPYSCSLCSYKGTVKSHLKKHEKTHAG